ncbi:coiled-coil domain-containing protein 17-like [Stylophora pistillata]|uniref:coiled-coil domain-containing protein 17-like n=1 Tax=Stylophora pistillata TaxID=50429 RepID=UPI000C0555C6|nr:coiled-coil domain-containing protein 17-like [Stylophora pistillata]
MVWECKECNMTFKTEQLYETHKKKFCFGNSVDPARIHSRISSKGGNNTEKRDRQEFQMPLPYIKPSVYSAPNTPSRHISSVYPENDRSKIFLSSPNHSLRHQSAPNTPSSDYGDITALEKEKIDQLKRFKAHHVLQRNSRNLEEKHFLDSIKDRRFQTSRRGNHDHDKGDDRIGKLTDIHQQQLADLKLRNEKLQEEKARLAERLNSLGIRSRQKIPSQGSLKQQATELDGLKRYLEFKEDEEKRNFHAQQSQANIMKVSPKLPPQSVTAGYVRGPELQAVLPRKSPRELSNGRGQVVPYQPSIQYYEPAPIPHGQSNVLHELNMLKNDYFQKGGHDPEILAQIRDLEYEAQRMQATQRPQAVDPFLQQQILSFHTANQRLEQELQLLREERGQKERKRSPEVDPEFQRLKEEHLVKMASLRQEAELLKQQAEVEKMRKQLKDLRGESTISLEENRKSPFTLTNTSTNKELQPSPYDPNAGFAVFWDFVLGMNSSFSRCRLAAGVYQGAEIATDVKLLPIVKTTVITRQSHPTIPPGGAGVIGVKHPFPRCMPDQNLGLVVELQANSPEDSNDPNELFSKGWTRIDLFDMSNRLFSGRWKIPIRIPPIKAFLSTHELNMIPQVGLAELYLRLVNSRDVPSQDTQNPQPLQHHMYKYPSVENIRVIPQVSTLSVNHSSPNFSPAPPPSVPPPPDTPVAVSQRAER